MTRRMTVLLSVALSFILLFSAVGYSAVSGRLGLTIAVKSDVPYGLFITSVTEKSGAKDVTSSYEDYLSYTTTVETTVRKNSSSREGTVTYVIRVYNNTEYEYAYRQIYYQENVNDNSYIVTNKANNSKLYISTSIQPGTIVKPGDYLEFEATYKFGRSMSRKDYHNIVNYQFGINVNSEQAAINAINAKFLDILNTSSTYKMLTENIDNKYDGYNAWTSNYMGNVADATNDDSAITNTLFAGQLQMTINGSPSPATVLIKREDLDGNWQTGDHYTATNTSNGLSMEAAGCEMTLYLTTASLDTPGEYVDVYVTVFTCDRDDNGNYISEWYTVGDTYKGKANVVSYDGDWQRGGSFVTDNWIATEQTYTYTPLDPTKTYTIAQDAKMRDIMPIVDNVAIEEFQKLLNRAKAVIDNMTYAGSGIIEVEKAYFEAAKFYTVDASKNPTAIQNVARVKLLPHIRKLAEVVKVAEDEISNKEQ